MTKTKIWIHYFCVNFMIFICTNYNESCFGAKLERKQDFFDVDSFDSKRDYRLNEIGKRGFTSTLGFDYSGSSEYGIGSSNAVNSDYGNSRPSSSDERLSPARDLIPPPAPGVYSSSTSPPSTRSAYSKFGRISPSSSSSTKDFHSSLRRSQISRRSPHHIQQSSLSSYFDDINSSASGSRGGRSHSSGSYGLVADNDGKLIGYRGSILPGYQESPTIITSSSPSISSDPSNFVGSYFPGSHSTVSVTDFGKSKFGLASSATSGSYTSTPVYYPGREEDHTYRMRDTTSQGYEDEDSNPSLEDSDFPIGGNTYQPSPLPPPPSHHHYHMREHDGYNRHSETSRYLPFSRSDHSGSGFSYGPLGKSHPHHNPYSTKRAYGSSLTSSNYGTHGGGTLERVIPYSYTPLSYGDYGSTYKGTSI